MPEEITVNIPTKVLEFIDKLTKEGYFNSREDFTRCSVEIIAQLYGLSTTSSKGKSLLDILADNNNVAQSATKSSIASDVESKTVAEKSKPEVKAPSGDDLTIVEMDIMDLFIGSKFEFEDALHAKYTMELMKLAKAPLPKTDFIEILESLASKSKIEKGIHNKKTVWKVLERY